MSPPGFLDGTAIQPPSEARTRALYASTSAQAASNPEGYQANVKWWTAAVEEALRVGCLGDRLVLAVGPELARKLDHGGVQPKGLGGVVCSLVPSTLHPLPAFMSSLTPIHDPGSLTYRLLGRPLWWAVSKVNPFASNEVEKEEVLWKRVDGKAFVHMPLLEVIEKLQKDPPTSYSASLFSPASFKQTYGAVAVPRRAGKADGSITDRDTEVLLRWLSRDAGVLATDGKVVRLLNPGQRVEDHPITEADKGTLAILETIDKVEAQVDSLTAEIAQCTTEAKAQLGKGQRAQATSRLRARKRLEEVLDKRLATLDQLRSVLSSIDTAQGDVEIMSAYEVATSTLKGVLANPLLDMARVEKTTEELADAMADQAEIDQAVRDGGRQAVGGEDVDEDELEAELAGLVLEEKERVEAETQKVREAETPKAKEAEARKAADKAQAEKTEATLAQTAAPTQAPAPDAAWQRTYELAQERKREEAQRAADERLRKEAA